MNSEAKELLDQYHKAREVEDAVRQNTRAIENRLMALCPFRKGDLIRSNRQDQIRAVLTIDSWTLLDFANHDDELAWYATLAPLNANNSISKYNHQQHILTDRAWTVFGRFIQK